MASSQPRDKADIQDIAIIGAGFTGLTAAYKLCQAGYNVKVFEASDVAGGLASGCSIAGLPIEKAYHFLYQTDEYMIQLLKELDIEKSLEFHKSSVSTYYNDILYPMENPIDLIRFKPLSLVNRVRAGLAVLYLQHVKDWKKLTKITAMDWLRKYAGRQVTDIIWEPLLKGKFDKYHDKVTMCWLWGRIKQRVDSRGGEHGGEALGYFNGGFRLIVDTLVDQINALGGKIEYRQPIKRISKNENDKIIVETAAGQELFDRTLLTVPCGVSDRLLSEFHDLDKTYFDKLRSVDYLDAAVLLFATDKKITEYFWHNINNPDAPFVAFLSLTALVGTSQFDGKHIYYIGDYIPSDHPYMTQPESEISDMWLDYIKKMFPDFDNSWILDQKLYRFKDSQHIVDVGYENKMVPHETPCQGVYLCNFSQIFPMDRGTNYAVRDGYRMAEKIVAS